MKAEIITLDGSFSFAQQLAEALHMKLQYGTITQFADGEIEIEIPDYERFANKTVVIVQSTYHPERMVMATSFLIHELENAKAQKVIGVIPYFGYSRQEVSDIQNKPGNAFVIARLFEGAGLDYLISVELHEEKIMRFFEIPVTNVRLIQTIAGHISQTFKNELDTVCLVAPDEGAQVWVASIAQEVGIGYFAFTKERFAADKSRITGTIGSCNGKIAIIIDDIISTGGTAVHACDELYSIGFEKVFGYFVHPVFAGDAYEKIEKSRFEHIFVGNTIPSKQHEKITVFDCVDATIAELKQLL